MSSYKPVTAALRVLDVLAAVNRLGTQAMHNKRKVGTALTQLSKRIGFRVAPGFAERVIFRELFPREAIQIMERDALTRYGLHELVTDANVLREAERSEDLLRAILQFKHLMAGDVLVAARALVTEIVDRIAARLETETRAALHGPLSPRHRSPVKSFKNTD